MLLTNHNPNKKRIIIKTQREVSLMMKACEISALALKHAGELIAPGITTWEIDKSIGAFIAKKGAKPSFKGLYGFPGNACISINEELIHGIPSKKRRIKEGDIISVDVGAYKDGFHGDNAETFVCGEVSAETQSLLEVTKNALFSGIEKAISGNRIGDISNAIQTHGETNGFFIPEDFFGHGVGKNLHEEPNIPNFGEAGRGPRLTPGMTIAIEPMFNASTKKTRTLSDGWTVIESNKKMSAHFEHTILITNSAPVIMTELR